MTPLPIEEKTSLTDDERIENIIQLPPLDRGSSRVR